MMIKKKKKNPEWLTAIKSPPKIRYDSHTELHLMTQVTVISSTQTEVTTHRHLQ